jgi:hypothetical protein
MNLFDIANYSILALLAVCVIVPILKLMLGPRR